MFSGDSLRFNWVFCRRFSSDELHELVESCLICSGEALRLGVAVTSTAVEALDASDGALKGKELDPSCISPCCPPTLPSSPLMTEGAGVFVGCFRQSSG